MHTYEKIKEGGSWEYKKEKVGKGKNKKGMNW